MKILAVADLHYTLKQWDWLVQVADTVDLIVIAGDLLDSASPVEMDVQILVTLRYLRKLRDVTRLAVSSGNHDLRPTDFDHEARWLQQARADNVAVDGDSIQIGDSWITVCPWWDGPLIRQRCSELLETANTKRGTEHWIWIHHAPPQDSLVSWTGKIFYGDANLREWIDQLHPNIVLVGHVHNAPFADKGSWADQLSDTWVFNPGRQIGPVPTHLVLDLEAQVVDYYSLAGHDQRHLR
jgi:Icc-related predicted phosphoesterase